MTRTIRQGQQQILLMAWIAYAAYYLCRLNFGQVQGAMGEELGLGPMALGKIVFAYTIAYVVGQLVNGVLCDRLGAKGMAATGAFGSAAMCALLPAFSRPAELMIVWAANGFFQSMGFSACIRALANWYRPAQRGRVNGVFALSYQVGNVLAWLLAAAVAREWGWRFAFYVPAGALAVVGGCVLAWLHDAPGRVGLSLDGAPDPIGKNAPGKAAILATLKSGRVWAAGLASCFISVAMYGFVFWLPYYLQGGANGEGQLRSASMAVLFPLGGCVGGLASGWITDHRLKGRGIGLFAAMAAVGAALLWAFGRTDPLTQPALSAVTLAATGFFLMGAHVHVVGTLSMALGRDGTAGSATGVINGISNMGGMIASIGTAAVLENARMGWGWAFPLWAVAGLVGAGLLALVARRH